MTARLRSWFLRDVLDAIERARGSDALARARARLSDRVRAQLPSRAPRGVDLTESVPLEDGEELLLVLDAALDDGSGSVLEAAAAEVASSLLSRDARLVQTRDLMGTVARLRTALERPFVDVAVLWEMTRSDEGFALTVGLLGRPRSTRLLCRLVVGYVRAADRFALETGGSQLRVITNVLGDRATITAMYRMTSVAPPESVAPVSRPSRPRLRAVTGTNLAAEVERILGAGRASSGPPPAEPRTSAPPRRREPEGPVRRPSGSLAPPRVGGRERDKKP